MLSDAHRANQRFGIRGWFFLVVILGIFFGYQVGNRPFVSPDEGRYVEIPREMVVSGDYVTPRLDGVKYFEKPPLFYWMEAAAIQTVGIGETSMRFIPVLFAVLGCLTVFFVGYSCYSLNAGLLSVAILATNILYYVHSRLIILDMVLSVFMSGSLWAFFLAFVRPGRFKIPKNLLIILMYAFSALACLTKGLIGAVLPGMVVFLWIAATKNWKIIREALYLPGIGVFLAIFLPWHILAAYRNHDFLYFYFIVEHFLRYSTKMHGRYQPFWFFFPIVIGGLIPWAGATLMALVSHLRNIATSITKKDKKVLAIDSSACYFLMWVGGILIFFSVSGSKLIPYILPIFQPLALITSVYLEREKNLKPAIWLSIALFFVLCAAAVVFLYVLKKFPYFFECADFQVLAAAVAGMFLVLSIVLVLTAFAKIPRNFSVFLSVFLAANIMWTLNKAVPYYLEAVKPSTQKMAETVRYNWTKDDLVFSYNHFWTDFPVYLGHTTGLINFVGELEFGVKSEPDKSPIMEEEKFWQLWNKKEKRIFLLMTRSEYRRIFVERTNIHKLLDFDSNFVVITNK